MQKIIISSIILLAFFIGIGTGIVMEETKPFDEVAALEEIFLNTDNEYLELILNVILMSIEIDDLETLYMYTEDYILDSIKELLSTPEEEIDDTPENIKT